MYIARQYRTDVTECIARQYHTDVTEYIPKTQPGAPNGKPAVAIDRVHLNFPFIC